MSDYKRINGSGSNFSIERDNDHLLVRLHDYEYGKQGEIIDYILKNTVSKLSEKKLGTYKKIEINLINSDGEILTRKTLGMINPKGKPYKEDRDKIHLYTLDNYGGSTYNYFPYANILTKNYNNLDYTTTGIYHYDFFKASFLIEFQRHLMLVLDVDKNILEELSSVQIKFK